MPTVSSSGPVWLSSRRSIAAVTGWSFFMTVAPRAGSNRTAVPFRTNVPSLAGTDAGRTMSLVAALPAVFAPGFSGYMPAMLAQSRR